MKKEFLLIVIFAACVELQAQYTQTLPLDYNDFFRTEAIAEGGTSLERGEYGNTSGVSIMANQWNRTGKSAEQVENSPALQDNTLSFGAYIDNESGKEILLANLPLNETSSQTRTSVYSLKNNYDYSGTAYYLAALVKITEATGKGDIIAFDGNFTANAQRARLYVNKLGNGYCIGLGWNGEPSIWTEELAFGSTHLVVMKVVPAGNTTDGTEEATLWIDPDISKVEAENTPLLTLAEQTIGLKSVRGITVRQRSKIAGSIAGLRFGDNWADVVKTTPDEPVADMDRVITNFNDGTWGDIIDKDGTKPASGSYGSSSRNDLELNAAYMMNGSITCAETSESFTNRIVLDKQSQNGMVTLPAVSSAAQIVVHVSSGGDGMQLKLQKFNYYTGLWSDVAIYTCVTKSTCYRFCTILNSDEVTKLRLINVDSSGKNIWKIQTYPMPPVVARDRIVFNFCSDEWNDLGSSSTTVTVNEVDFTKCSRQEGTYYLPSGEKLTARITLDKKESGEAGMMELPAVASAAQVDIYASAGTENREMKLQLYNYGSMEWEDVHTIHFDVKSIYSRFSIDLDNTTATRLRIINTDGSAKQILKVVTYPSAPVDLAVPVILAASNVASYSFTARWNAVDNANGYRIVVYKEDGGVKTVKEAVANATAFNITGLDCATNYTYKVASIGDDESFVDSHLSDAIAVTTATEITDTYTRSVTVGNYGTICLPKACEDLNFTGGCSSRLQGKFLIMET